MDATCGHALVDRSGCGYAPAQLRGIKGQCELRINYQGVDDERAPAAATLFCDRCDRPPRKPRFLPARYK
ncbi:hypothetical protein GCM10022213_23300 [Parerythrobacter jejuensis]